MSEILERLSRHYYGKGLECAREGKISAAVDELRKSVGYAGGNAQSWKLAGLCFYRLGRLAAAEYCWTMCLKYANNDPAAAEYLDDVRKTSGKVGPFMEEISGAISGKRYGKAARIFRRNVLPVLDGQADAHDYLGILYMLSGRKKKAAKEWKKSLAIDRSGMHAAWYMANT